MASRWPSSYRAYLPEAMATVMVAAFIAAFLDRGRAVIAAGCLLAGVLAVVVGLAEGTDWRGIASQRASSIEKGPAADLRVVKTRREGWVFLGLGIVLIAVGAFYAV